MDKQKVPETMLQAVRQFADPQTAVDFFVQIRWPNGIACPRSGCGSDLVAYLAKQRRWYCNECKKQFSAKVGTIFEDSPIGLDKWLPAIWLVASNKNGVSSHELARALKVTQKTAWFMLQRVRLAMKEQNYSTPLTGEVEADEAFIGGRAKFSKKLRAMERAGQTTHGFMSKTPVFGLVQRGGKARAWVVKDWPKYGTIAKMIEHVHPNARLHTDSLYRDLTDHFLAHDIVNHAVEYVNGNAHVNNVECFWSVLKRTLKGTYIHVAPEHLERYLDEQLFRFNERENTDGPRFANATKGTDGKRLTYKTLTGNQ